MTDKLFAPRRFADAIERVAERRSLSPSAPSLHEGGVSLATIRANRDRVARLLVRDLLDARLDVNPGRIYHIRRDGKARRLYHFPLLELVIHDAVANWLTERAAPALSPHLYSYRSGTSYHRALCDFGRYVRSNMPRSGGRGERGLYVLRRDVRAYFDSIPVHDESLLWSALDPLVGNAPDQAATWSVLRRALRPPLRADDGRIYQLERGIPTGSPVANVVANVYLSALDLELASVPGAFYARYGDDVIAAHPVADTALGMGEFLATHLLPHELEVSSKKTEDLFLNFAGGRADPLLRFQTTAGVEFLGHLVNARGNVSLSAAKTRSLLRSLRTRAAHGARGGRSDVDARIAGAVHAINRLLDPLNPAAHPYAKLLRTTVTDRDYLKWLDHELALVALEAALGGKRPAHFRSCSPRALRTRFRLRSLVTARNRVAR